MVLTRAARKQRVTSSSSSSGSSSHADETNGSNKRGVKHSTNNDDDDNLSLEQPKSKRQKTATTAATRNARALKPVNPNSSRKGKAAADTSTTTTASAAKPTSKEAESATATTTSATVTATHKSHRTKAVNLDSTSSAVATSKTWKQQQQQQQQQLRKATSSVNTDAPPPAPQPQKQQRAKRSATATSSNSTTNATPNNSIHAIDERYKNNPLYVTEYVQDMYRRFRSQEIITFDLLRRSGAYPTLRHDPKQPLRNGGDITEHMRSILIDWMIEVHYKFRLVPETLFLSIQILDRFMSECAASFCTEQTITRRNLQCVGVTSLFIACKYEEMFVPEIRDLTYICDGAYTESQILDMEETILKALEYKLTYPTPYTFLKRFLRGSVHDGIFEENDETMENLSLMILDSTLLSFHGTSRTYLPSQLAAGAIALARRTLLEDNGQHLSGANTIWNPTHEALTSYTERDVMEIAKDLFKCHQEAINSTRLRSLVKKYSKPKYGKVSSIQVLSLNSANGE